MAETKGAVTKSPRNRKTARQGRASLSLDEREKLTLKFRRLTDEGREFIRWTGKDLRAFRKSEPFMAAADLGKAIGYSQAAVSIAERRKLIGERFAERLSETFQILIDARGYVDPASGLSPEEEFFNALGLVRALLNKYRPLIGKETLSEDFEAFFGENESVLTGIYKQSVQLSRAKGK